MAQFKTGDFGPLKNAHGLIIEGGPHEAHSLLTDWQAGQDAHQRKSRAINLDALANGDESLVPRSDAMLAKIEASILTDYVARETVASVTGGIVNVPAYLAGTPMAMRRRQTTEAPKPITLFVEITTANGLGAEVEKRRGAAALALVRALEVAGHPVALYVCSAGHVRTPEGGERLGIWAMRVDTSPIDLARGAHVLGPMLRYAGFCLSSVAARHRAFGGHRWPTESLFDYKQWLKYPDRQRAAYADLLGVPRDEALMIPVAALEQAEHWEDDKKAASYISNLYARAIEAVAPL